MSKRRQGINVLPCKGSYNVARWNGQQFVLHPVVAWAHLPSATTGTVKTLPVIPIGTIRDWRPRHDFIVLPHNPIDDDERCFMCESGVLLTLNEAARLAQMNG
jgi:hypothetical protein